MNETVKNISAQKNAQNAVQKVNDLMAAVFGGVDSEGKRRPGALEVLSQQMDEIKRRMNEMVAVVDVLVDLAGAEAVQKGMEAKEVQRAQEAADRQKAALDEALLAGDLMEVETVGKQSIVVGRETVKATGKLRGGDPLILHYQQLNERAQEGLLGKSKGFVLDAESPERESQFEVLGVYEAKPKEVDGTVPINTVKEIA